MINSYLALYSKDGPRWEKVEDASTALDFESITSSTTSEFLLSQGVSSNYIYEVVEAATRVNYGQDVDTIHALEGACSMAADNASGVSGGNFLLFEQFLKRSGANVFLKTPVSRVRCSDQRTVSDMLRWNAGEQHHCQRSPLDSQELAWFTYLQGGDPRRTIPPDLHHRSTGHL